MQPRDLFDLLLVALLTAALSVTASSLSRSTGLFWAVVDAVFAVDITVYLIIAGILGAVFVGYIAVYLPRKQSRNVFR